MRKRIRDAQSRLSSIVCLPLILAALSAGCSGGADTTSSTTTSSNNSSSHPLSVQVNGDGDGTVSSSPSGISCGTDCSENYSDNTSVTLTAAADADSEFDSWSASGVSCPSTDTCTMSMTSARTATATFRKKSRLLTVSMTGSGTVTSSPAGINCGSDCTEIFRHNTSVVLTAVPMPGYTFSGWSGSNLSCPGTGTCTIGMAQERTVTATFSPVAAANYLLQVSRSGSGTVTSSPAGISCGVDCNENYTSGTSVILTATPASGQMFSGWSGGGCTGSGGCTVSMTMARTVTATFVPSTYLLSVTVSGSGSVGSAPSGISCGTDCSENYTSGTGVTLTATPASGYTFSGWSGSGIACTGTGTCTVSMTSARNVTATFSAAPRYTLSVSVSGSGSVASAPTGISCGSDCTEDYASGTTVTLTATPASGYRLSGWSGACSGTGSCTVSMTAARSVTASFVSDTATATYRLAWNTVVDPLVTGYRVYYSTSPLPGGTPTGSADVTTASYVFDPRTAGMTIGTRVYFGVTAVGVGLESPMSDGVSIIVE